MANNDNLDDIVIPDFNKSENMTDQLVSADKMDENSLDKKFYYTEKKDKRDKRTVYMILGIVFFVVSFVLAAAAVYWFYTLYLGADTGSSQLDGFLTVIIFAFTYGLITYVPAFSLTITGIVMSGAGAGSESKPMKVVSIIFLILNILLLIALIGMFILAGSIAMGNPAK